MIALLGMYDRPETAAANDRLWAGIRARLGAGPEKLCRDCDFMETWLSPDLLLSQTCGLPFRARLHDKVRLIGTPEHALPDCPPGHYNSVIVAHRDDADATLETLCTGTLAYNDGLSQSGWAAPHAHLAALDLTPAALLRTGGHRASAESVATGAARFAALDAVTWELIRRYDAFASDLAEVTRTAPTPALPYITNASGDAEALASALEDAIADLSSEDRETLCLHGICHLPASAYLAVPIPPTP
ncbi:MAG: PhnD/SsuA/transferrin family substrate-binding protein [Rhodobacteraceae bacterium]|nr:PhnD/SsuA/transferrin family substrate-binding protein [Paracoccaceae bacterium]